MKKNEQNKKRKESNKGTIFVRIMAGFLAIIMVAGTVASLIAALM